MLNAQCCLKHACECKELITLSKQQHLETQPSVSFGFSLFIPHLSPELTRIIQNGKASWLFNGSEMHARRNACKMQLARIMIKLPVTWLEVVLIRSLEMLRYLVLAKIMVFCFQGQSNLGKQTNKQKLVRKKLGEEGKVSVYL